LSPCRLLAIQYSLAGNVGEKRKKRKNLHAGRIKIIQNSNFSGTIPDSLLCARFWVCCFVRQKQKTGERVPE
jgi:hypothetical protein